MSDVLAGGHHFDTKKLTFIGVLVSLGIVLGDIGTSPLYVMSAIIKSGKEAKMISEEDIEGALSCIIWTLTLQTTIKYVLISLRADNKGEGGILALFSFGEKNENKMVVSSCNYRSVCINCRWSNHTFSYGNGFYRRS